MPIPIFIPSPSSENGPPPTLFGCIFGGSLLIIVITILLYIGLTLNEWLFVEKYDAKTYKHNRQTLMEVLQSQKDWIKNTKIK